MPALTLDNLHDIAGRPDTELRMAPDKSGIEQREGSWGGRAMRNLKIAAGAEREAQRTGYRLAKVAVLQALVDAYGKEIGTRAFRAGVGRPLGETGWQTSADHPITGRHVERMLRAAERLRDPDLAGWMAGRQDVDGAGQPLVAQRGRQIWPPPDIAPEGEIKQRLETEQPEMMARHTAGRRAAIDNPGRILEKSFAESLDTLKGRRSFAVGQLAEQIGWPEAKRQVPHEVDFWVASIALGHDQWADIGLALSTASQDVILVRDRDGTEAEVARDEIAGWLEARAEALGGRLESVRHVRLASAPEPLPLPAGERDGQPILDADGLLGDEKRQAIAERLASSAAQDWRPFVDEGPQGYPPTLARRLESTRLVLRLGDQAMRLTPHRDIEALVRLGKAQGLTPEESYGLARFLDDEPFQQAYRAACARLGGEGGRAKAVEVEVGLEDRRLAVTFRAPLPESLIVPFDHDRLSGNELDLAMTILVPRDELTLERPQLELGALRVERHAERPPDDPDDLDLPPPERLPPGAKAGAGAKAGDGGTAAWIQQHWLDGRVGFPDPAIWRLGPDGSADLGALVEALARDVGGRPNGTFGVWILPIRTQDGESEMIGFKILAGEPPIVDIRAMDGARAQLHGLDGLAPWLRNFTRTEDLAIAGPLLPVG